MKKIISTMIMLFAVTQANAQSADTQINGVSASTANQVYTNTGNNQYAASDVSRAVGFAAAPALTTTLTET